MSDDRAQEQLSIPRWFCAAMLLASPAAPQKAPDTRIDSDPSGVAASINPRIASTGSEVFVVWQDDRNGSWDIYFDRSTNAGATWAPQDLRLDTDAPGAASSTAPEITVADDNVYVVWADARSGGSDIWFNRSTDGGATWLPADIRVNRSPVATLNAPLEPQIRCDGREVYVVWQNGGLAEDIYFERSIDGGLTWLPEDMRIDRAPAAVPTISVSPSISSSGSDVYVVWRDNRHGAVSLGGFDIYGNRSTDGGRTWLTDDTKVSRFGDNTGHDSALDARIESEGDHVYVAWWSLSHSGWTPDFNRSIDAGMTWLSESIRLNNDEAGGRHPEISHQGDTVYAVWVQEGRGRSDDICFNRSSDAGTTWWTTPIRIDTGETGVTPARLPQICSSGDNVFVVWEDGRAGRGDIHFNRSTDRGVSWLPRDVRLDTDLTGSATSARPRISATRDGVYVAWMDRRAGSDDIYFNIPFGLQPYGSGTAGSNGIVPQLAGSGLPLIGGNVSMALSRGRGGSVGAMLIGNGSMTMTPVPVPGGSLLLEPTITVPLVLDGSTGVAGAGTAALGMVVPRDVTLVGWNLNFQGVIADPAAAFGVSMTNAVEMWIG